MKRPHPIFSPLALLATASLLALLGITLLWHGGQAFSPGQLSEVHKGKLTQSDFQTHSEFQEECTLCHAPFAGIQIERCGACHELVMDQLSESSGFHGQIGSENCMECHTEHQGREFDLLTNALADFNAADHAALFLLDGAHEPLECTACHMTERYADVGKECHDCHQEPDVHRDEFGQQCRRCHTSSAWLEASMSIHPFPLDHGVGLAIPCASCHQDELTIYSCQSCHEHRPELNSVAA